jgi:MFS transporter, FHS family, L-fucose permease
MKNTGLFKLLPVFFGYFIMGFADVVGISTNYARQDFSLSNTLAYLLPMMVFVWFFILSVPTGLLMNKVGRKNIVLASMVVSALALLLPTLHYSFFSALLAFALLGIGNTLIQVSLNPLVTNVISNEKLPSSLTLGQCIKATASLLGPVIATFASSHFGNWKYIFPVYAIVSIISALWLASVKIEREKHVETAISFGQCFGILKNGYFLMLFTGILLIVGIDVGLNTTIPKYLMNKCHMTLDIAGNGTTLYFGARAIGTLLGTFILIRFAIKKLFLYSALLAMVTFIVMLISTGQLMILITIAVMGLSCANIFSMIFALALQKMPDKANEISGLMMMGVSGGALVLPVIGLFTDWTGVAGGMMVLLVCLLYILIFSLILFRKPENAL